MLPSDDEIIEGRRPDRARVWTLSKAEVFVLDEVFEQLTDDLGESIPTLEQIAGHISSPILARITRLLHQTYLGTKKDYPRRGDLVYLEHELSGNKGKYFYDGSNIIPPSRYNHELSVPSTFQVIIEFPIRYWEDRFKREYSVPFNFVRYFPTVDIDEIKVSNTVPYFEFVLEDNKKKYTIYANIYITSGGYVNMPTRKKFLAKLQTAVYFSTLESRQLSHISYPRHFPHNMDPNYTLILEYTT